MLYTSLCCIISILCKFIDRSNVYIAKTHESTIRIVRVRIDDTRIIFDLPIVSS